MTTMLVGTVSAAMVSMSLFIDGFYCHNHSLWRYHDCHLRQVIGHRRSVSSTRWHHKKQRHDGTRHGTYQGLLYFVSIFTPNDHSHFKSEQDTLDVLIFMSRVACSASAVMVCPGAWACSAGRVAFNGCDFLAAGWSLPVPPLIRTSRDN